METAERTIAQDVIRAAQRRRRERQTAGGDARRAYADRILALERRIREGETLYGFTSAEDRTEEDSPSGAGRMHGGHAGSLEALTLENKVQSDPLSFEEYTKARRAGHSQAEILAWAKPGELKTLRSEILALQAETDAPAKTADVVSSRNNSRTQTTKERESAKKRLDALRDRQAQLAGAITDDMTAAMNAAEMAKLDRQIAEAQAEYRAAMDNYEEVFSDYNAARDELKAADRALREQETNFTYPDFAENIQAAQDRLAKAQEAYIAQGGDPNANVIDAGLRSSAAGIVDAAGYLQELGLPENEKRWGIFTTGHMSDADKHHQQVLEARRKAKYEAEHGEGSYVYQPGYRRTQETADRLAEQSASEIESMKTGKSELGQFAIDLGVQGVQMGADAVAGRLLPGGSLTAMALRSFGSGVREARSDGADLYQQGLYGTAKAAVEVLTEKMFDGMAGLYGGGFADDVVSHWVGKLSKNKLGQAALGVVFDAVGEGTEELISDVADPFLKTIYNGMSVSDSFKENWDWKEVGYDFLVGAVMGAIGGSIEQVGEATGLKAPDERSEFFMQAGEQGLSFEQAQSEWSSRNELEDASGKKTAENGGAQYMSRENMLSESDLDDYLKTGSRNNKNKTKALQEGKKIILTTPAEIINYIRESIKNGRSNTVAAYGKVNQRLASDVSDFSKSAINIEGKYLELNPYDLQHAYDEHRFAKEPGDIDLTEEDFENIPMYLENYDDILYARTYDNGQKSFAVSKRLPNGRIIIIEIDSKSRNAVQFKNAIGVSEKKYVDVILPKYRKSPASTGGSKSSNSTPPNAKAFSDNSILNTPVKSKSQNLDEEQHQRWDTAGAQLTEGQQKYFADSKIRDADGRLEVMYRGGEDSSAKTQADSEKYLRRLEEIGYLPAEQAKTENTAHDGAAENANRNQRQKNSGLQSRENNDILATRIVSGALNPDSKRAEEHAKLYYESVRHMKNDVQQIAKNTGLSEQDIALIKQFIFLDEHDLGENGIRRFFPSFEIAQSWQRLIDGKSIKHRDLTLLYHEIMERQLMLEGMTQEKAHMEASREYNYTKEVEEYYDKIKKHKKG